MVGNEKLFIITGY